MGTKKKSLPEEYKDVAKVDDVNALEQRVEKCYSEERYERFQEAVEKITLRIIDGSGRERIKAHAKEAAKDYNQENGWTKLTFWIPTTVSIIVAIGAVAALFLRH